MSDETRPRPDQLTGADTRPERPYPAVAATYTPDDDVNPICGHHKRNQCLGCGGCTVCDGCYCYED